MTLLFVGAGGAGGAVLRYLVVQWAGRLTGETALGTLCVNVVGSLLMGVVAVILLDRLPHGSAGWAPLVMAGFLGGFTTFSAFSLDAYRLWETGRSAAAIGYVGGSVALSLAAVVIGFALARWVLA